MLPIKKELRFQDTDFTLWIIPVHWEIRIYSDERIYEGRGIKEKLVTLHYNLKTKGYDVRKPFEINYQMKTWEDFHLIVKALNLAEAIVNGEIDLGTYIQFEQEEYEEEK